MTGTTAYALSKKYAESLSSGIQGSSYDPSTGRMTVSLNDGNSYEVEFDDGITVQDREVLDNVAYDNTTSTLQVNGVEVLTKENIETENIDFSSMF